MISREQAGAIAALTRTIRPAWDALAIMNVIGDKLRNKDLAEVTWAAVRAAQNTAYTSPVAIAWEGEHWRPGPPAGVTPEQLARREAEREKFWRDVADCNECDDDGRLASGYLCSHDPERIRVAREGAARVRAEIRRMANAGRPQQTTEAEAS